MSPPSARTALINVHTESGVTNVAGQALVPVIVAAREKILDLDVYNSASASPVDDVDERDAEQAAGQKVAVPATA